MQLAIPGRHELYRELLPWLELNIGPITYRRPAVEWAGQDWRLERRHPYSKNVWWVTIHTPSPEATFFALKWAS